MFNVVIKPKVVNVHFGRGESPSKITDKDSMYVICSLAKQYLHPLCILNSVLLSSIVEYQIYINFLPFIVYCLFL